MMEVYLLILLKIFGRIDYKIQVIWLLSALITHNHAPQNISVYICFRITYIKFKYFFSMIIHQGGIIVQYEKYYTIASHPVGATATLCV